MNANTILFEKRTVAELSEIEMTQVDGGTTIVCVGMAAAASSEACAAAIVIGAIYIANAIEKANN